MTCGNNCAGCDCKTEPKAATPYEYIQASEAVQATASELALEHWHKNALAFLMRYRSLVTLASQFNDGDLDLAINSMDDVTSTENQFIHHLLNVPVEVQREPVTACCGQPDTCDRLCRSVLDAFRGQVAVLRKQITDLKAQLAAKPPEQPNAILWPKNVKWNSSAEPVIGSPDLSNLPVGGEPWAPSTIWKADNSELLGIPGVNDIEVSNTSVSNVSVEKFAEAKAVQAFTGLPVNVASTGNNRST